MLIWGLAVIAAAAGCGERKKTEEADSGPVVINLYGSLDETYKPFLTALAEEFPEISLHYEYQWDEAGVFETERRLLHGDGPDMAVVNGSAMESLTEQKLLLDLTNEEFSTRYHVSTMTSLNDNGRIFALPLPNDVLCLICNRSILNQYGITDLPENLSELADISRKLTEQGQGAVIADSAFYNMILSTGYICTPKGYDWIQAYNTGNASMSGTPAAQAWDRFAELAAVSGCSPEDTESLPARRTGLMLEGKYAFRVSSISNLQFMLERDSESDLIALPMLGETTDDQWAFYSNSQSMRFFVASAELDKPENAAKKSAVLQILDWISTGGAQQLLASCGSVAITYVNGVKLEQGDIMEYINPVIASGHLTTYQTIGRGTGSVINSCAAQIAAGILTAEEAVELCDTQAAGYVPPQEMDGLDEIIGTASDHVYWRKPAAVTVGSPMAQLAALAMAETWPEADFAFAMAKNTASSLYPGDITLRDVLVCTDGEGDRELMLVQATGRQIKDLIDAGIGTAITPTFTAPYGIAGAGRLIHPAGLTYKADVTREKGDKITELSINVGDPLEMDKTYTIAVSGLLIDGVTEPNLKGCEAVPTGKHLYDVLADYIRAQSPITSPEPAFEIIGAESAYTLP